MIGLTENMRGYHIRLRPDQIEFLRTLENASQWIREQIDKGKVEFDLSTPSRRIIALAKEKLKLAGALDKIDTNSVYRSVRRELEIRKTLDALGPVIPTLIDIKDTILKARKNIPTFNRRIFVGPFEGATAIKMDNKCIALSPEVEATLLDDDDLGMVLRRGRDEFQLLTNDIQRALIIKCSKKINEFNKAKKGLKKMDPSHGKVFEAFEVEKGRLLNKIQAIEKEINETTL